MKNKNNVMSKEKQISLDNFKLKIIKEDGTTYSGYGKDYRYSFSVKYKQRTFEIEVSPNDLWEEYAKKLILKKIEKYESKVSK